MKKAITLLLLGVLITSLTMADVHQGTEEYGVSEKVDNKYKKDYHDEQYQDKKYGRQRDQHKGKYHQKEDYDQQQEEEEEEDEKYYKDYKYHQKREERKEYGKDEKRDYGKDDKKDKDYKYHEDKQEKRDYGKDEKDYKYHEDKKEYRRKQKKDYQKDYKDYEGKDAFVLTFQYAARDGLWNQDSNRFAVVFNGKLVKEFLPNDYKIHKVTFKLKGRKGKNSIHFIGKGVSDSYGSQVDNIRLIRDGKNYIRNGGFEEGHKLGTGWLIFKNGEFKGWNCKDQMEVGWGRIYNQYWPKYTHVCELDAIRNSDIFQKFDSQKDGKYEKQYRKDRHGKEYKGKGKGKVQEKKGYV